jgi:hypothetical protein
MLLIGYIWSQFFLIQAKTNFACPIFRQLPVDDSFAARVAHCALKFAKCSIDPMR